MLHRVTPVLALLIVALLIPILIPTTRGVSQGPASTPTWEHLIHVPSLLRLYGGSLPTATATHDPIPSATPTSTATATSTSFATSTATAYPTSTATAVPGLFINGDFELGAGFGWQEWNNYGRPVIRPGLALTPPVIPSSGAWLAALKTSESNEISQIWQDVTLPPGGTTYLNFNFLILSQELCDVPFFDFFTVYVDDEKVIDTYFCSGNAMDDWDSYSLGPSVASGETVRVLFEVSSIGTGWTTVCLDDISIDPFPR